MNLSLILAKAKDGAIGANNGLLWHLPKDFKWFKTQTQGHAVIMGRLTYESIGKPLPNRTNYIITSNPDFKVEGDPENVKIFSNIVDAVQAALAEDPEPFIIGGANIYAQTINIAKKVYVTEVDEIFEEADSYVNFELPEEEWKLTFEEAHEADDKHKHDFKFKIYERL